MSLRHLRVPAIIVVMLSAAACSRDPEVAKQRHLAKGNAYFEAAKYREAILEYRTAIRYDAKFGEARLRLAEAYTRTSDRQNAYREYVRAADLLPDRADVQVKAGNFLLVAGRFDDAKARAERVLQRDPKNADAQVLLGYALAGMKNLDDAVDQLERALMSAPQKGIAFSNLGTLQMARGDLKRAEATFRKAVEVNPDLPTPWIALANFLWTQGQFKEAEACLVKARDLDPRDVVAARALAILYMSTNRVKDAEPVLKGLAETSTAPAAVLMLSDYYAATNRPDDALAVLTRLSSNKAAEVDVKSRTAVIRYAQGHGSEAHAIVDGLLKEHADRASLRLIKAQFLLRDRRLDEALAEGRRAIEFDSRSALGYRLLGETHAARYELTEATQALTRSLEIEPRAVDVQLQLARVELARGRTDAAMDYVQQVVRNNPNRLDARLLIATTLMQSGDLQNATAEITQLAARRPDSPDVQIALGRLLLLKGDHQAARQAFARALSLAPDSADAFAGAVNADIAAHDVAGARQRLETRLAASPRDVETLMLSARTYFAAGDPARAEHVLRQVIDIDAEHLPAYALLGQLYVKQQRLPDAQAEFERLAQRRPGSTGARTMVATLLHLQNRLDDARRHYEAIVHDGTDAAVASNNLAWLYATWQGNLDVALTLAQAAKKQLPDQPEVSDTLGWIYYRKGLFDLAADAFEQSVQKDPNNPIYLYHLGLSYVGRKEHVKARRALERALEVNPRFDGADDARRVVSEIRQVAVSTSGGR
jgi:putative PEP-CTERM system TPR-repeat lipoprotein